MEPSSVERLLGHEERASQDAYLERTTLYGKLVPRNERHEPARRVIACSKLNSMDRIVMLTEILTQNPADAFARYGLAMEYSNAGEVEQAMEEFAKLLSAHPEYTAGYFMAAQTLVRAQRLPEARKMLSDGITSAKATGNAHAQSEMEAMLAELDGSA